MDQTRTYKGFVRVAAAVPRCEVVGFEANAKAMNELWNDAESAGCSLVIFPELALSSYTARDLFLDHNTLSNCETQLLWLKEQSRNYKSLAVIGSPLRVGHGVYNVAVAIQNGEILAVVPKSYIPNYREFEELRWFRPGTEVTAGSHCRIGDTEVPFGTDLLLESRSNPDLCVGLEVCEDYWVHVPPSMYQVSAGATIVANLSASNFVIGKAEIRRNLAVAASDRGKCCYLYVAAGPGESSTDLAFDADAFICENGGLLAESKRFLRASQLCIADIDLSRLIRDRLSTNSFGDCSRDHQKAFRRIRFNAEASVQGPLKRHVEPHPFLPKNPDTLAKRCWETFEIQSNALATRLAATGIKKLVLGVSGGLDSTHAALVCAAALDLLDLPRANLLCYTMPGLGTTGLTRGNAEKLAYALGAKFREIPVSEGALLVLKAMGHEAATEVTTVPELLDKLRDKPELGNIAFENSQARMRTLLLMNLANEHGGLVVGTGDLSEKALGWATYSGDHISMYDVNAGIPKTLIQFVIRWVAKEKTELWSQGTDDLTEVLYSILETPISPELLPADSSGKIAQLTEDKLGPYELHDFYLYHFVRAGATPERILDLAQIAFGTSYSLEEHKKWLSLFFRRFFHNQFKRSCTADAPKVGMVALSPRGDWRMPSDAKVTAWLSAISGYA